MPKPTAPNNRPDNLSPTGQASAAVLAAYWDALDAPPTRTDHD